MSRIPAAYTTLAAAKYDRTLVAMRSVPQATHADYPQYAGHWDDWVLVVLARNIELKGGRGLDRWQVTIGQRRPADTHLPEGWSVYSPQRDSNVYIGLEDAVPMVRVIGADLPSTGYHDLNAPDPWASEG